MEPGESPTKTTKPNLLVSRENYPNYSAFERVGQEDKFLTPEELIIQTDAFMLRFEDMIKEKILPRTLFFLDKSARPIAYIFRKLFSLYYPGVLIPEIRFINIGGSDSGLYDKDSRPFTRDAEIITQAYGRNVNILGRILIIDEYSHTGQALKHATEVLGQAFPEAIITTLVAYNKLPNWYQNETYLGVKEYTKYDYEGKALARVNEEFGTNYRNKLEMINDDTKPNTLSSRFWEIYDEIQGTIPYVKKGEQIRVNYEYPKQTLIQRFMGVEPKPVEIKTNVFLEARKELDTFCEEIIKRKTHTI